MSKVSPEQAAAPELTRPFAFSERLRPVPAGVDPLPFVDFFLLGLFALFLLQPLLFSPGVGIELPSAGAGPLEGVRSDAVVTIWNDRVVTAQGSFPREDAALALERLWADLPAGHGSSLLLLADRGLPFAAIQELLNAAGEAGFAEVQVAARAGREPPHPADRPRP